MSINIFFSSVKHKWSLADIEYFLMCRLLDVFFWSLYITSMMVKNYLTKVLSFVYIMIKCMDFYLIMYICYIPKNHIFCLSGIRLFQQFPNLYKTNESFIYVIIYFLSHVVKAGSFTFIMISFMLVCCDKSVVYIGRE